MGFASSPFGQRSELEPAKLINTPLGATSPLWFAFMGAASAGVAYWWMTRWARPFNIEAMPAAEPMVPVPEAAMIEAVEAATTVVEEVVIETMAPLESAPVPVAEPEPQAPIAEPVIMEAAEPEPVEAVHAIAEAILEPPPAAEPPLVETPAPPKAKRASPKTAPEPAPPEAIPTAVEAAPVPEPAPEPVIEVAKAKPTATPARVSARTKRRQPDATPPNGPAKRR